MNILKIAKAHKKALMSAPAARYVVSEWIDPDTSSPIELLIMRPSAADLTEIKAKKIMGGESGEMAMTIIRCCYRSGETERRAFVDTDIKELLENVDQSVLKRIYTAIIEAIPDLGQA